MIAKLRVLSGTLVHASGGETFWPVQFGFLAKLPAFFGCIIELSGLPGDVSRNALGGTGGSLMLAQAVSRHNNSEAQIVFMAGILSWGRSIYWNTGRRLVALLLLWSPMAAAEHSFEFVAEHLPEVAMDNRFATLPLWSGAATPAGQWQFALQGALARTTAGAMVLDGPMLSAAARRQAGPALGGASLRLFRPAGVFLQRRAPAARHARYATTACASRRLRCLPIWAARIATWAPAWRSTCRRTGAGWVNASG
jgi:hypothetical protein